MLQCTCGSGLADVACCCLPSNKLGSSSNCASSQQLWLMSQVLTFLPDAAGVAASGAASLLDWLLLGTLPTLMSLTTSAPSSTWACVGPDSCPAAGAITVRLWLQSFSSGNSSSTSDRSLPCLSSPDRSAVQLPNCSTSRQRVQASLVVGSLTCENGQAARHTM